MATRLLRSLYQPRRSWLRSCDVRIKFACLLLCLCAVFLATKILAFCWCVAAMLLACILAEVKMAEYLRALRPALIIIVASLLLNTIKLAGTPELVIVGSFGLSIQGFVRALMSTLRIVVAIGFLLAFAVSTPASELTDALVSCSRWRCRSRIRNSSVIETIAMIISLALRFVPLVAEELERIIAAQRARGRALFQKGLFQTLSDWKSIIVPLSIMFIRRAQQIAEAMDERCFGRHDCERTLLLQKPKRASYVLLFTTVLLFAAVVGVEFL